MIDEWDSVTFERLSLIDIVLRQTLAGRLTLLHLLLHSTKEKGPITLEAFCPGGTALYFSLSISFDFICSMELFTLSSESVSLPYLFLNLWALVQTLADLYLNVSSTLSRSLFWALLYLLPPLCSWSLSFLWFPNLTAAPERIVKKLEQKRIQQFQGHHSTDLNFW